MKSFFRKIEVMTMKNGKEMTMKMVYVMAAAVVLGTGACRSEAQEAPKTILVPSGGGSGGVTVYDQAKEMEKKAKDFETKAQSIRVMDLQGAQQEKLALVMNEPRPARQGIITTQAMAGALRGEWGEDLKVMEALVSRAMGNANEEAMYQAMGIRVGTVRWMATATYVEGWGVLVTGSVSWPLAGEANAGTAAPASRPTSAWEQAKSELEGAKKPMMTVEYNGPKEVYDAARVSALQKALVSVLAEGKHFRHLPAGEQVIISISGPGAGKGQARLTMKARKADMDQVEGAEGLEAFGKKVQMLVE